MSVCLKLDISVTIEMTRLYFPGDIPTGPLVVLGYFKNVYLENSLIISLKLKK